MSEGEQRIYASRGAFKAQQLGEAWANVWDAEAIIDVGAGYGGFAQYYTVRHFTHKNRNYLISSLVTQKHRQPELDILRAGGSQANIIRLAQGLSGDVRDPAVVASFLRAITSYRPASLVVDFGETFQEAQWWYNKRYGRTTIESVLEIAVMMPEGSRMIVKVLGASQQMLNVFTPILALYNKWSAFKMPTASEASREWYLFLDHKRGKPRNLTATILLNFWHGVRNEIFEAHCRAVLQLQRSKTHNPHQFTGKTGSSRV